MSRSGLWFSIEPLFDVKQFKSSPGNKWAKFCTYDEWLIYIKPTLEKRKYTDMMEWPQFGKEVFLQTVYSDQIRRCIVLSGFLNLCSAEHWCSAAPFLVFRRIIKKLKTD
jgi:hypothetical protein